MLDNKYTEAAAALETRGEKLVRLMQEKWEADRQLSQEIRDRGMSRNFDALHASSRLYNFIGSLAGEEVNIRPLDDERPLALKGVSLHMHPSVPAEEGRSKKLNGEARGRILKESGITSDSLLLRRISMWPLFRLPRTYEVEILNSQTGEPQVEVVVGEQ